MAKNPSRKLGQLQASAAGGCRSFSTFSMLILLLSSSLIFSPRSSESLRLWRPDNLVYPSPHIPGRARDQQQSSPEGQTLERRIVDGLAVGLRVPLDYIMDRWLRLSTGSDNLQQELYDEQMNDTVSKYFEPEIMPSKRTVGAKQHSAYFMSPISNKILEVKEDMIGEQNSLDFTERFKSMMNRAKGSLVSSLDDECHTIRSAIQLAKDDVDKATGLLLRSCKGVVQVNRCDGSCGSSVQPSIKSLSGFRKVSLCL